MNTHTYAVVKLWFQTAIALIALFAMATDLASHIKSLAELGNCAYGLLRPAVLALVSVGAWKFSDPEDKLFSMDSVRKMPTRPRLHTTVMLASVLALMSAMVLFGLEVVVTLLGAVMPAG